MRRLTWFLTGVITPLSLQSTDSGRSSSLEVVELIELIEVMEVI